MKHFQQYCVICNQHILTWLHKLASVKTIFVTIYSVINWAIDTHLNQLWFMTNTIRLLKFLRSFSPMLYPWNSITIVIASVTSISLHAIVG